MKESHTSQTGLHKIESVRIMMTLHFEILNYEIPNENQIKEEKCMVFRFVLLIIL